MANEITTPDALQSLKPKSEWVIYGDTLEWLDAVQTEPTTAELEAEVIRLQAAYDAQNYARNRKAEYPSIGDQLDALYHAGTFDSTMTATLKAVKDKYPKE